MSGWCQGPSPCHRFPMHATVISQLSGGCPIFALTPSARHCNKSTVWWMPGAAAPLFIPPHTHYCNKPTIVLDSQVNFWHINANKVIVINQSSTVSAMKVDYNYPQQFLLYLRCFCSRYPTLSAVSNNLQHSQLSPMVRCNRSPTLCCLQWFDAIDLCCL